MLTNPSAGQGMSYATQLSPFSGYVNTEMAQVQKSLQVAQRRGVFVLGRSVHENVRALRHALGSIRRELSAADLAERIAEVHPFDRPISASTVQRWEKAIEPDLWSIKIMAELAG